MVRNHLLDQCPAMQLLGVLARPVVIPVAASASGAELSALSDAVTDWKHFVQLAQHHRLCPIVSQAFPNPSLNVPDEVVNVFRRAAAMNAIESFRYLSEVQRILAMFSKVGISAAVLKGVPLSLVAYGTVATRDVGDVDLLIAPEDAERADSLLRDSGMIRQEPASLLTERRRRFYTRYQKDYTYSASSHGFEIDLHWRLLRDRATADCLLHGFATSTFSPLSVGSMQIQILAVEACIVYLAVHGGMEGWARWKTLLDIAALWAKATPSERSSTWILARRCNSESFLSAALVLFSQWMHLPIGEENDLPSLDRRARYIIEYARRQMTKTHFMPSPAGASSLAMKWHEIRLRPSLPSLRDLVMRVLFRSRMWEVVNLPDQFFFLYPLFSPVEWILFRARTRRAR